MKYIDMHCDTISDIWYATLSGDRGNQSLRRNHLMIDLEKLTKGDCLCQNFGLFVKLHHFLEYEKDPYRSDSEKVTGDLAPYETVQRLISVFRKQIAENADRIRQVTNGAQIRENDKTGRISALMTIEEGGCCEGSLDHLQALYDAGARMMTLTWNYENELAYPNYPDEKHYFAFEPVNDHGLKPRGQEFVRRMGELGMLVDVSHLSDAGFMDVAAAVKGPFVASHSNARAVCGVSRNLTDEMIRMLAEHGGVMGLNFCKDFLAENLGRTRHEMCEAAARHAKHIIEVGGEDCIGIGSDFDGIGGYDDMDATVLPELAETLEQAGLSNRQVEKIFYGNVLRVYDEVLR